MRPNGGGGISRVLTGGKVFEKAGVNLSVVYGTMPQEVGASPPIPNVWGMYQLGTSWVPVGYGLGTSTSWVVLCTYLRGTCVVGVTS